MSKIEITPEDRAILEALAAHGVRVQPVARECYMHRNTVIYRINRLKKKTGLDAMDFYDLQKLLALTEAPWKCQWLGEDECKGLCENPQCPMAGEKCPIPERHGVCRFEAIGGETSECER